VYIEQPHSNGVFSPHHIHNPLNPIKQKTYKRQREPKNKPEKCPGYTGAHNCVTRRDRMLFHGQGNFGCTIAGE